MLDQIIELLARICIALVQIAPLVDVRSDPGFKCMKTGNGVIAVVVDTREVRQDRRLEDRHSRFRVEVRRVLAATFACTNRLEIFV